MALRPGFSEWSVRHRTDENLLRATLPLRIPRSVERSMTDVYVYSFIERDGPAETNGHARPRATLETIKAIGDPIMESQIVVDDAELDSRGFFLGSVSNDSRPSEDVRSEIRSLNLRAAARDREALTVVADDAAGSARKYMLELESRELRKQ